MKASGPFAKRVNRHVVGPAHVFFAATAPFLEMQAFQELKGLSPPLSNIEAVDGGVAFQGKLQECYAANLLLRIPNRILMRLASFKATNFRQLEKKLAAMPWELLVDPSAKRVFSVQTRRSRLYHRTAVAASVAAAVDQRLAEAPQESLSPAEPERRQRIFVRARDDRFTVSLDSSGDLLFKRGLKQNTGRAPLRETLAAAILAMAGYTGGEPLADPMCGSGTFSLEAAMLAGQVPPGWYRSFAFMGWPAFRPGQWTYLKKTHEQRIRRISEPVIFASDRDPVLCRSLEDTAKKYDFSGSIRVSCRDFFDPAPAAASGGKGLVVLNPPFGVRLKKDRITSAYYREILAKLTSDYRGWRLALLLPDPFAATVFPGQASLFPIYHGGLKLTLVVGRL